MPKRRRKVTNLKALLLLAATVMMSSACSGAEPATQSTDTSESSTSTTAELPLPVGQELIDTYPEPGPDDWRIGVEYTGLQLVDRTTNESLDASSVEILFFSRRSLGISAGGCGLGSGDFDFVEGQIRDLKMVRSLVMCAPTEPLVHSAVGELLGNEPFVSVRDERLLLYSDQYVLELVADGPGVNLLIESGERFRAIGSTVPNVVLGDIEVSASSFFAVVIATPTCQVHGDFDYAADVAIHAPSPLLGADTCAQADDQDRLAHEFFEERTTLTRDGDTLTATNSWGSITFELSSEPPLVSSTPTSPFPGHPPIPSFGSPQAGRVSTPLFPNRVGGPEFGIDLGVPSAWVNEGTGQTWASNDQGGRLWVETGEGPYETVPEFDGLSLMGIPDTITAPLFAEVDGVIVETGETITFQQFRFGSNRDRTWQRGVAWVIERNGQLTIVKLSYPLTRAEEGPVLGGTTRTAGLGNIPPEILLADIRIFD